MAPNSPIKAKTQPFSSSLQPKPPLSGAIEVNRMNVPCIMLNPIRNRKLIETNDETVGSFMTPAILLNMPPNSLKTESSEDLRFSSGRLSGNRVTASTKLRSERALENRQGSR